jgi:hypothetical protein
MIIDMEIKISYHNSFTFVRNITHVNDPYEKDLY